MSTITLEDIQAYAEVDYIINHMNQKYIDKIPSKMREFFSTYKDPNHVVKINPYVPLENQGLKKYTLELIALLHLKFWCEDEARKQELYAIMVQNQEKLEEQMEEKYSIDNIFKSFDSEKSNSNVEENVEEIDYTVPKGVQKYDNYVTQNDDIQDYTDIQDDTESFSETALTQSSEENTSFFKGLFSKMKEKIKLFK